MCNDRTALCFKRATLQIHSSIYSKVPRRLQRALGRQVNNLSVNKIAD
jgi:hypothetical protein